MNTKTVSLQKSAVNGALAGLAGGVVFGILMASWGMLSMVAMLAGQESAAAGFIVHMLIVFIISVVFVVGLSLYLGKKAKTARGYYAADGKIHWSVNGIAFAGDYLSAASFLGICGMIATVGYEMGFFPRLVTLQAGS